MVVAVAEESFGLVVSVGAGLSAIEVRRRYPFGIASGVLAGAPAIFGESVVDSAGQGEVVDVGAPGGGPLRRSGRLVGRPAAVADNCGANRSPVSARRGPRSAASSMRRPASTLVMRNLSASAERSVPPSSVSPACAPS
ncbi:hypothetical protein A4G31_04870 [Mycobacterium persicum]|nr:hypothetical protein A4G31_04870 [Mycobacterium persicum]